MMHSFLRSRLANVISWIVPVSLVILTIGPSAPANPVRAQGAASVDPAAAIWALIPADATVAITINSDPESAQWPVAADLLETAGLEDLIYGALNEILTSGNLSTSNIDPGQSKVLGGSMAFATWGTPSDPTDSAAFYVAADDPEAAFQTLTSQLLVEDGAEIVSLDIPGGRITVDDAGTSAMMLLNDVVVFTESDDAEHIASLVTGAAPTLDAFDPFVEVMEALPEEQIARAWFNGPAAGQESAETLSDFGLSATNLAFVLAVAGPIGSTFTGLGLHAGADGFHWRTAQLPAPIIGPDPPGRGASVDLAESISNEADIYLDGTDLGATPLVQQIIAAIALNAGMRSGEIWGETGQRPNDFALERFRELTGIDLQAELIDQLTGDYQVAIAPNNDVSLVDVLARSELGDPDVVRDLIEKLVVLFNVATIENPELGELTSLEIGQDTLYTISFTDGSDSVDVSFGVIGDQLQLSLSGGAERFPSPSAGSDLGTDQQYLAAFAALPEDEGSRIYIDLADLLPAFGVTDLNPPDDWAIPNRTNATIAGIKALAGIRYAEGDLAITDYVLLIQADERAVPDAPPAAPDATPVAATSLAIGDVSTIDLGEGVLSLSPDGSRAVVGGEGRSFCIVSLSEPTASACTDAVSGADVEHLAWSPDGSLIAVTENSARYFFDSDIWIIDTATGDSTNLTDDGYEGPIPFAASGPGVPPELPLDGTPIFSADGKSLYFSRSVWTGNASSTDIYRINLDGREPERITRIGRQPFLTWGGMHWIDKGTLIVSHGSTDDHPDNGLWTVDVESGRAEQVWRGSGMQYLATPLGLTTEGNVLAQFPLVLAQFPEPVQVCGYGMIDLETGIVTDLKAKDGFCAWSVGLSPDGSRAIISSPAEPALTVVDLATLELTPFAQSGVSAAATDAGIVRPVLTGAGRGPIIWSEDDRLVLLADATTVMTIQLEGSP